MKSFIAATILCGILCGPAACASSGDQKAADQKSAGAPPKAATIPKDAVANPDGTYSYTDQQGKKWTFLRTPFGIIKRPAMATDAGSAAAAPDQSFTKAIDKGDTVRFERKSPFGTVTWEKKKSDLTDEERQILAAQTAKSDK